MYGAPKGAAPAPPCDLAAFVLGPGHLLNLRFHLVLYVSRNPVIAVKGRVILLFLNDY